MSKSKVDVDSDGFQIVGFKRFSKNKQTKVPPKDFNYEEPDLEINIEKSKQKIHSAVKDLKDSAYLENVIQSVSTVLHSKPVIEIVCFGLGHISECNISRYQLGLLLCLKQLLLTKKVLVHDPIFYKAECSLLKDLGLEVIEENKQGSYIISDDGITLLYFPHCPKQLTNNFLWSNWSVKLHNCVLICNSFNSLVENHPSRIISETVPYIHKIIPFTIEKVLDNQFKYTDIFNDTSIHSFPLEKLSSLKSEFWTAEDKPTYQDTEEFITSLMIEKLKL